MKFETTDEAITYFANAQAEIVKKEVEWKEALNKYKAETKEYFGIEDGRPMNLIELVKIINFMGSMSKPMPAVDESDIFGSPI